MSTENTDALPFASVRVGLSHDRSRQRAVVLVGGEPVAQLPVQDVVAEAGATTAPTLTLKLGMELDSEKCTTEFLTWAPEQR